MQKLPKILYFIEGSVATAAEQLEIDSIHANVSLRNASMINPEWTAEACDGVAGAVPESYAHMPNQAEALAKLKVVTDSVLGVVSEVLAPEVSKPVVVEKPANITPQLTPKVKAPTATAKPKPVWNPNRG